MTVKCYRENSKASRRKQRKKRKRRRRRNTRRTRRNHEKMKVPGDHHVLHQQKAIAKMMTEGDMRKEDPDLHLHINEDIALHKNIQGVNILAIHRTGMMTTRDMILETSGTET